MEYKRFIKTGTVWLIVLLISGGIYYNLHQTPSTTEKLWEIDVLQDPTVKQIMAILYDPTGIAEDGSVGRNQAGFSDVANQRDALPIILRGVAENNPEMIDHGIKAIEYGFRFQEQSGNFKNELGLSPLQAISGDAFFLQAVGHAALAVKSSPYLNQFSNRFTALKPQIEQALNWLSSTEAITELKRQDRNAPNRLVFDALAYTLNGIYLERNDLQTLGDEFVIMALGAQRPDGVFLEGGGHDSSYQATNILNLEWYVLWSKNNQLRTEILPALESAVAWEKDQIDPNTGRISTEGNTRTGACQEQLFDKCKDVNYREVIMSLAYWSVMADDSKAQTLARKVLEYAKLQSQTR
jgi:hypothetical protein